MNCQLSAHCIEWKGLPVNHKPYFVYADQNWVQLEILAILPGIQQDTCLYKGDFTPNCEGH